MTTFSRFKKENWCNVFPFVEKLAKKMVQIVLLVRQDLFDWRLDVPRNLPGYSEILFLENGFKL